MKESFILVYGNPKDGFLYIGPFRTAEEAATYGEYNSPHEIWWVDKLTGLDRAKPDPILKDLS